MMKKLFFTVLFVAGMSCSVWAQQVVDGKVVDRNGVPIPGARIEAKNGGETTLSEFDGSFHLETQQPLRRIGVDYVGMQSKTVRPSPSPMTIVMTKTNIWTRKSLKPVWMISLQGGFPESTSMPSSVGLMIGRFNRFGWYAKGLLWPSNKADLEAAEYVHGWHDAEYEVLEPIPQEYWWTTGKMKKSYSSFAVGGIADVWYALHVYAGVGWGWRNVSYEITGGRYVKSYASYSDFIGDFGLLVRLGRVSVNGGVQVAYASETYYIGNIGIGICF